MIVYLDTSVALRVLLRDPHPVRSWGRWTQAYSSRIWLTEALRTIDRLRLDGCIGDEQAAQLRREVRVIHDTLHIVPVSETVLRRAGEAFPTTLGTLDAIHLASALAVKEASGLDRLLTHDRQLATAAEAVGLEIEGV